jgi:hypothetical protein
MHSRCPSGFGIALATALGGCATAPAAVAVGPAPASRGGVTLLGPRCTAAASCLLGHVTAAENGSPVSRAAVFLELERHEGEPRWILALTDEQGVFEIDDPPPGRYRLSVYAPPRGIEMAGIELGARGTTMLPVRLPPG